MDLSERRIKNAGTQTVAGMTLYKQAGHFYGNCRLCGRHDLSLGAAKREATEWAVRHTRTCPAAVAARQQAISDFKARRGA